ncbi:MAG: ATP-binding cassette domain-containing protein, partial [Kiritimatiellae bacterium]|nr:ATP-binding cassette domain-containing protein [Kiritimatiellia bacterium]
MDEPIFTCTGLAVGYGGRAVAAGIDFSVGPGQCVCVVGENGAGKSTLLRTVLGLAPAVAGEVRPAGDLRPGDVGYLPQQNPVQGDFPATAREVVLSGRQAARGLRPFFRAADRRAADEALARFGADGFARRPYREL